MNAAAMTPSPRTHGFVEDRQVADLVYDQQRWRREKGEPAGQWAAALGLLERGDQADQRGGVFIAGRPDK